MTSESSEDQNAANEQPGGLAAIDGFVERKIFQQSGKAPDVHPGL